MATEHVDVLIIGAGLSGIGAARFGDIRDAIVFSSGERVRQPAVGELLAVGAPSPSTDGV